MYKLIAPLLLLIWALPARAEDKRAPIPGAQVQETVPIPLPQAPQMYIWERTVVLRWVPDRREAAGGYYLRQMVWTRKPCPT